MNRFCLVGVMSVICGSALAQTGASMVDGDWIGKGSFQLGSSILACDEIRMKFVGTATLYGVRDGAIACETVRRTFPMNDDFTVQPNDDVYYKGEKVGQVSGDRLVVLVPGQDEIGTEFTLRREGDLLYYNEFARKPGHSPVFGMVAILRRNPGEKGQKP